MPPLRIALRYFFSRKSHGAVNVISMISVAGVAVATAAMVCVLSVFNGFSDLALSRTSLVDPPLKVVPAEGKVIRQPDSLVSLLMRTGKVATALPVLEEAALAEFAGKQVPVRMKGVPEGYAAVVDYTPIIIDSLPHPVFVRQAALSVGVAVSLEARPGYDIPFVLYTPRRRGRINPAAPVGAFRSDSLLVGRIFQAEEKESDTDHVIVPIDVARHLLDYSTEASAIELAPAPDTDIPSLREELQTLVGADFRVLDRVMQQEEAFRMINIEKWVTFVMLAFIIVIAAFNIVSTLAMLTIEKERDSVTLSILGASRRFLRAVFTWEGALITIAGGVAGVLIGVSLSLLQQYTGLIKLGGDHSMMIIDAYPVRVQWADQVAVLAVVAVVAIATSLVARFLTPSGRSVM